MNNIKYVFYRKSIKQQNNVIHNCKNAKLVIMKKKNMNIRDILLCINLNDKCLLKRILIMSLNESYFLLIV
jgi:hypothetical protein